MKYLTSLRRFWKPQAIQDISGDTQDTEAVSLCEVCRNANLSLKDFESKSKVDREIIQRTLRDIKQNPECSLCRLIAYAVENTRSEWERGKTEADEEVTCHVRLEPYRFPTTKPFRVVGVYMNLPFHGPSYGMNLLPIESASLPGQLIGKSLRPEKIPLHLIHSWIEQCCHSHKETCGSDRSGRFYEISDLLNVIDVENYCVIHPVGDFRYLALSYVWGHSQSVMLTRSNFASLSRPGGLFDVLGSIPLVIRDAIFFTQQLGERYLWIDSLCIVQDDMETKQAMIDRMNLVYEYSFVTLFATTGKDADAGLPGVRSNTRNFAQPMARLGPNLTLMYPISHAHIKESIWASRGWTYQEYFFAKRRLIFHNGIAIFKCCNSTWREDLAIDTFGATIDQFDLNKGFNAVEDLWELPRELPDIYDVNFMYSKCIRAFMKRNLTHEDDILNAFAGVNNFISKILGLETLFGLPLSLLGSSLFWSPQMFQERRHGFPSWSWCGWKGSVWEVEQGRHMQNMSSWIPFYPASGGVKTLIHFDSEDVDPSTGLTQEQTAVNEAVDVLNRLAEGWTRLGKSGHDQDDFYTNEGVEFNNIMLTAHTIIGLCDPPFFRAAGTLLDSMLIFRTLTAQVWISARAPDGEICEVIGPVEYIHLTLRPALYLYSTMEPSMENLGIAWLNDRLEYSNITEATVAATPEMPRNVSRSDPFSKAMVAVSRGKDDPPNTEEQKAKIREILVRIGTLPGDALKEFPKDPTERAQTLTSRQIRKVKIAILSGPVMGEMRDRIGVPMSFPYTTHRGFFRVLVLKNAELELPNGQGKMMYSERAGIGELELDSLNKLEGLKFENILLG